MEEQEYWDTTDLDLSGDNLASDHYKQVSKWRPEYRECSIIESNFCTHWKKRSYYSKKEALDICNALCEIFSCRPIVRINQLTSEEKRKAKAKYAIFGTISVIDASCIELFVLIHELSHHFSFYGCEYIGRPMRYNNEPHQDRDFLQAEELLFGYLLSLPNETTQFFNGLGKFPDPELHKIIWELFF